MQQNKTNTKWMVATLNWFGRERGSFLWLWHSFWQSIDVVENASCHSASIH